MRKTLIILAPLSLFLWDADHAAATDSDDGCTLHSFISFSFFPMTPKLPRKVLTDVDAFLAYTRKDAIADGVLVDLSQGELSELVRQAGFVYPIAMTCTAFERYVAVTPAAQAAGNDVKGRLWDILTMLRLAIRRLEAETRSENLTFQFLCIVDAAEPVLAELKAIIGPDDDGDPCLTLLLPDED